MASQPLVWDFPLAANAETPRDGETKTARLDLTQCLFLKLMVHASLESHQVVRLYTHHVHCLEPHIDPLLCELSRSLFLLQVILEEIEVLGSAQPLRGAQIKGDEGTSTWHSPLFLSRTKDEDSLETVLLEAGVSLDLVSQVVAFQQATNDPESPLSDPTLQVASSPPTESNDSYLLESKPTDNVDPQLDQEQEPVSPFDSALRQYVEQNARETAMLESVLGSRIHSLDLSSWQSPTLSARDPANSNEVTLYTFGGFFTQCLLCGTSDVQVTCVRMVERYAQVLKTTANATAAFEGIVAVVVLALRGSQSTQVFQTAIHLAHTLFQAPSSTRSMENQTPFDGETEATTVLLTQTTLGLVQELPRTNWSHGLRVVLESALANPRCWSISTAEARSGHNKTRPGALGALLRPDKRDSTHSVPPTVDREFLQFMQLLLAQELTSMSFFEELLCELRALEKGSAVSITFRTNRLRLLRLLLRSEGLRSQVPASVESRIQTLCRQIVDRKASVRSFNGGDTFMRQNVDVDLIRLASDCLEALAWPTAGVNASKQVLSSIHKHLEATQNSSRHHSALFLQDPLTAVEASEWIKQMQRYFSAHLRPSGLYRHCFVRGSLAGSEKGSTETQELLQKGNITFRGLVEARTPPTRTFHQQLEQKTTPFVFEVHTQAAVPSLQLPGQQEIASSFAAFRGSIERRSDLTKRSSRIAPEGQSQSASIKVATPANGNPNSPLPSTRAAQLSSNREVGVPTVNSGGEQANPAPTPTEPAVVSPVLPLPAVNGEPNPPEPKQESLLSPDPHKSQNKGKSKPKNGAKDPDNCVIQ
ncbi:hypothetical protein BBJ28_00002769 [Nothophytophthora sp. Chile5]|nr:hypothetical protein BBJ28_00002769 [Nothophytophthora sp. Chile5]